ncbi:hypothetical protein BCU68_15685 [Vibrio sp. 10N.286.49.B3]|uniref:DUF3069 domain-containing protein n=1 Tax=Vibrio sp. 10N.286.49.B3 TaxID=1880855 RepID=UPI000C85A918|nr:DUF3069 domain-containing protein [Vibrio sp. 10N.286.49.B3]PMH41444.1 hypothetical protein BCU68_15685 [Vibrio sp. 10N.286.49.B3]
MSDATNTEVEKVDLTTISQELRQVIEFDEVPEAMQFMIVSIHEVSEETVREAWETLPASAQNVLDNFEQFHALISVSQGFAGISVMEEFPTLKLPEGMTDEEKSEYQAQLLDQVLHNCVKDMVKQIKKARRDAILKRDFTEVFTK